MILGTITGKITTGNFSFVAREEPKNFEYVQVYHKVYDFILCQIVEVTKQQERTLATCQVIGYRDGNRIKRPRIPFDPDSEVLRAEDEFITQVINLPDDEEGQAVIGQLDGRTIPVAIDLNKVLTKHVAVLAKSGAGKSYTVGVLLEEIAERGVPFVIIDPHGEYAGLARENDEETEKELMPKYGITPKAYPVAQYADTTLIPEAKPLLLPTKLSSQELTHLLPGKLSANQQAILYSALKNLKDVTFDNLLYELEAEESPTKYSIISTIEYLRGLPIFSANPTPYHKLIKPGRASIINLKGIAPDVQEIIVYKLAKDLFTLRKQNKISPFFLVIEEAHNYCPERSFGETKASKVLRDIASEGRKFGLGMCVVSQRPARVDKSVLSQCTTQIVLKVTNPNDLKALSSSIEGLTSESEKEIKYLPIGTALVTGITEVPLFVTIRPRRTAHGGHAVDIINSNHVEQEKDVLEEAAAFSKSELLPLIKPVMTPHDLEIMSEEPILGVETILIPAYHFTCRDGEERYKLLVEMEGGSIIIDKENMKGKRLPRLDRLSKNQLRMLQAVYTRGPLAAEELVQVTGGLAANEDIKPLQDAGYVTMTEDGLNASEHYVFTKLQGLANHDRINYEALPYNEKRPSVISLDDLREHLNTFTTVEDQDECYLVTYRAVTGDRP